MGGQGISMADGPQSWFGLVRLNFQFFPVQAGVNGYEETRSRQEGAVKIAPQRPASATTSSSTGLNTDAIIAQVRKASS